MADLEEHINLTESLSHPIPENTSNKTIPLTKQDLRELANIPSMAYAIEGIKEKCFLLHESRKSQF